MPAASRLDCPHAAVCAGCPLIELSGDEQMSRKRERVARATAWFPTLVGLAIEPTRPAEPSRAYRTRAKLVVAPGPRLGLYARQGDHVVVDIPDCRVLAPSVHAVAAALRALLHAPPAGAASVLRAPVLRAVDLREAVGPDGATHVLVTLVLDAAVASPASALAAAAQAITARAPLAVAVAVSVQASDSPRVLGHALRPLSGPAALPDTLGATPDAGAPWCYATHGGFVQVHRGQAARIRALVADALDAALGGLAGRRVVDAYAGSGATGLSLAQRGAEVVLVESHEPSAAHARAAAAAQGPLPVTVVAADVAEAFATLAGAARPVDAVVLNPPRRGVSPPVRASAAALARAVIAYVSCDPDTLARDLDHFRRLGWATGALVPFDMIPQTAEVETVAILRRSSPPAPVLLYADDVLVAVDKAAHEPTQAEGEGALAARVRALPGLAEAVPLAPLDAGTSGVCLFARGPAAMPPLTAALGAPSASASYEALCRGAVRPSVELPPLRLRRLRTVAGHSLVAVQAPPTGTRGLRRKLARTGHPILGDDKNGHAPSNRHLLERHGLDRLFLHCTRVSLVHPRTGTPVVITSTLAGELAMVLARMDGA